MLACATVYALAKYNEEPSEVEAVPLTLIPIILFPLSVNKVNVTPFKV